MSPETCACMESGEKFSSLVGPLLFLGFTTTRYPVKPFGPVKWFSWPGMVQRIVNEVGPTWENWRLLGGEMAGGKRKRQCQRKGRYSSLTVSYRKILHIYTMSCKFNIYTSFLQVFCSTGNSSFDTWKYGYSLSFSIPAGKSNSTVNKK